MDAKKLFVEAEAMQKEKRSWYPLLYSLQGFQYCDLLLGQRKYQKVKERAGKTLEYGKQWYGLLDIALDHLSLGRACLFEAITLYKGYYTEEDACLNQAVKGLKVAEDQEFIARGLLARASFYTYILKWIGTHPQMERK